MSVRKLSRYKVKLLLSHKLFLSVERVKDVAFQQEFLNRSCETETVCFPIACLCSYERNIDKKVMMRLSRAVLGQLRSGKTASKKLTEFLLEIHSIETTKRKAKNYMDFHPAGIKAGN